MVSALDSGVSGLGLKPLPGTLCCVLGKDTLLSRCLSNLFVSYLLEVS